jgi:uncharacterized protein YneR
MKVQLECDTTEYYVTPKGKNESNVFYFQDKAMIINFVGKEDNILNQSEISKEDALRLARLINNLYDRL